MELMDAIYHRRAVREFTEEKVDGETIEELINAAIQAPSAMNLQPWAFAVVRDRAAMTRISDRAKAHLLTLMTPGSRLERYRDWLEDPRFDIFYGAPALVVICARPEDDTHVSQAAEDCYLAAQNLMLAAHGRDLATCWVGFSRPWLETPEGKQALGVPESWTPVAPLILGHPKLLPPSHGRKPAEIVWRDGATG